VAIQLAELAVRYGCSLLGDPDATVDHVATLQGGSAGALSFLANPGYHKYLADSKATAVVLEERYASDAPGNCLVSDNPYAVYAGIAQELHPRPPLQSGVHSSAVIGANCEIPASCQISAGVVIGDDVSVGENVYIGANTVVGNESRIGRDTVLSPNISCYHGITIGERCLLHSGCVIGADGFGIAQSAAGWVKVPQVGGVVLGNDVEVGAGTTIDRGAIEDTVIGDGVKLDNQVQIAHNVVVGSNTAMAAQSGIAGSTTVGARCLIGGGASISGHITIADDVILMGRASVANSIDKPGAYSSAITVEDAGKWRRIAARIKNIDDLAKRLIKLERISKTQD
jgi:UDP-3-O-[3-hydroxymyristoyl] glucosamine N-acyltransferase